MTALISPGSPCRDRASLRLTIALIMAAAGMVLVIACANASPASNWLARPPASRNWACGSRWSEPVALDSTAADGKRPLGLLAGCTRTAGDVDAVCIWR